ncbi:hypothetical protein BK816_02440 [Boudabousia tangfeifanii]|uniref:N-acetyltransferase domain-containing protein n=2 Tax=Boudabousia tangfeifanii TaxID=1912795 RepID=A0A1D9MM96_9ACTO|nr:hypothetical protein BK816_02440 [Boudabousia tangfeifanii]
MAVRYEVFVKEQGVPPELEIDGRDPLESTTHVWVENQANQVLAVGRLLQDGAASFHLGRVAVLAKNRGRGYGRAVMFAFENAARALSPQGQSVTLQLSSQEHAIGFYRGLGYELEGSSRYLDAGIWHRDMVKRL